jgi:hypothetical protein
MYGPVLPVYLRGFNKIKVNWFMVSVCFNWFNYIKVNWLVGVACFDCFN